MCYQIKVIFVFLLNMHITLTSIIQQNNEVKMKPLHYPTNLAKLQDQSIIEDANQHDIIVNTNNKRSKRASGPAENFAIVSEITHLKMFRMFCKIIWNVITASTLGGSYPLKPDAADGFITHYKLKLLNTINPHEAHDKLAAAYG